MKTFWKKIFIFVSILLIAFPTFSIKPVYSEMKRLNMSYIYFGKTESYISYVEKTNNSLNQISPNYFNIDEKGELVLTGIDKVFIEEMHKKNIKVIPFLSNHWNRELGRLALKNKKDFIKDIVTAILEYNLDGVNVDIENLTGEDRDDYSEFVKKLREELPRGKILSVAVAPNPYNFQTGWQESYDYEKLANYSDYLVIMAYDESYPGGVPGPVASLPFVEKSIQYAVKKVSSDKILLGIPFFGRYWKDGERIGGAGISLNKVEELLNKYEHQIIYDKIMDSPKAIVKVKDKDSKTILNSKTLTPGTYTIWFENDKSLKKKLQLVEKYNLKGSANWSLGQETRDIWKYYYSWLNGYQFIDTNNHWAEEYIFSVNKKGWMMGTGEDLFSPEVYLTRAQAAVTLVRALELKNKGNEYLFPDVPLKHWAYEEICIAKCNGIIKGNNKGEFNPDEGISREEMAAILDRILEDSGIGNKNIIFKDVNKNNWSYDYIKRMVEKEIFKGYEDGTFKPKNKITRAQMAALMVRISKYINN